MNNHECGYELGPIRPPSEARSLLIRISRNCPWNRCLFCPVYKFDKFSRRSVQEIKKDIDIIAGQIEEIGELSSAHGSGGVVNKEILGIVYNRRSELFHVANWLWYGDKTVFLQDADNLIYSGDTLCEIITYLKEKIEGIERITTYARSKSLVKRSPEELKSIKDAGLTCIHVGLESGSDRVLELMKKGVTGEEHVEAGRKVRAAGLILSEYVILGLGGEEYWMDHALQTAEVLNKINPDFIRVRTLAIHPVAPLMNLWRDGLFFPLADEQVLVEEKTLIENLEGIQSEFHSDHILNLLEEIQGVFPKDKAAMLNKINDYLLLPDAERELFRLGRRSGLFRYLKDRENLYLRSRTEELLMEIKERGLTVDEFISDMVSNYL